MKKTFLVLVLSSVVVTAGVFFLTSKFTVPTGIANTSPESSLEPKPNKTMRAFASSDEMNDFFAKVAVNRQRAAQKQLSQAGEPQTDGVASNTAAASPSAGEDAKSSKDESITNNQHAGVDEGGIVKLHGDHLVILRRGRLFTVRIGDDSLKPVDSTDAYAPGVDPRNDWYDEMLISGDTVVVIGYSYGRGGTEINLFDIDAAGSLDYRSTYHLRSNDYYSSRNYASRLIGTKLVFYTPEYLSYGDATSRFPAIRKWHKGVKDDEFRTIIQPTHIYRPEKPVDSFNGLALHTVTICDLANKGFSCTATGAVGAPGRVFYVSPESVYVWTTDWNYSGGKSKANSTLFKMPLDGSAPSAMGVMGSPVDQFSFLESEDRHINVLVRSDGYGEQMWGSEFAAGDVALFRLPIDDFSDGSDSAPSYRYRTLPKPQGYTFQNRFVGDYLLFGTGSGWGQPETTREGNLFTVNWKNGDIDTLDLDHGVDRIEQMGKDAVVVGTNGNDLYFSPIRLGQSPKVMQSYVRKNASQGELRSHGFFYKPDGKDSGLLGLPIAREGRPGYKHLIEGSAAILFLRNSGLDLDELGEMGARNLSSGNDGCRASCVDWYGNARPLFIRNRVFALLGYEIVEGSVAENAIRELRRINYSPGYVKRNVTDEE
ncbi:MAG: beta-propeller domain-containing protein [Acidobacteriota bacterium]